MELIPLTEEAREIFLQAGVTDYADEQVRDAGWSRDGAQDRARTEFRPVLERELAEAVEQGDQMWSAVRPDGTPVGWLWVRPKADGPARSAFLYQITVAERFRRQGYGRAMLAALEERLARDGIDELHLNVNVANAPARRLYEGAGYEQLGEDGRVCNLRKRLRR